MGTLQDITLTKEQREMLCSIINVFGTGEHPYADNDTLPNFTKEYIKGLLVTEKFIEAEQSLYGDSKVYLEQIKELLN